MENKKDPIEQIIIEDLLMEAASIDEEIAQADLEDMSDELQEKIRQRVYEQVEKQEKERIYAQLSEEDKKALELGRKMLKESTYSEEKVVYRRKPRKVFLMVAAVALLVLAMGITSIGGAERVAEIMKSIVGTREVVQIDTNEENLILKDNNEEDAYQKIKDIFGVEAVKIAHQPRGMKFQEAEIDKELQTALLIYQYNDYSIQYFISSHNTDSSWGIDVENKVIDKYYISLEQAEIEAWEYEKPETKEKMYSAHYTYNNLEYFLVGTMDKDDFEYIINNLKFF